MTFIISSTFYDFFTSRKKIQPVNFYLSFSLRKNLLTLFNTKEDVSAVTSIHGLRSISILCIMIQHLAYYRTESPFIDKHIVIGFGKGLVGEAISKLNPAVDSFLVISGVLLTRTALKNLDK